MRFSIITALCLVGILSFVDSTSAQIGFNHVNCSGAESPVVQEQIHDNHMDNQQCSNYPEILESDGKTEGETQTCTAAYGKYQWASVDCSSQLGGCEAVSLVQCAGMFISARVTCPMNSGGPSNGKLPAASANRQKAQCTYTDAAGAKHTNTCSCSDSSGCS